MKQQIAIVRPVAIKARLIGSFRLPLILLSLSSVFLVLVAPAPAAVTLGPANLLSPPALTSNVPETATADTATLVTSAQFSGVLQATLTAQGFSAANNWTLNTGVANLTDPSTFTITQYNLSLNPGGINQGGGLLDGTAAGSAFGETMAFTLNPNTFSGPVGPPPAGTVVTEHWLQYVNTNAQINGYGYAIAGQQGFWQLDNGQQDGKPVNGTNNGAGTLNGNNGPYYDSNATVPVLPQLPLSTPPGFFDFPHYYSGIGTYLHFLAIPTWDVYTPAVAAVGSTPAVAAKDSIDVGNFGVAWGFQIVPEPASIIVWSSLIVMGLAWSNLRRRNRPA